MSEEQKPKTEEELLAEHKVAFEKEPQMFVDVRSLILAVKKEPNGTFSNLINPATRHDLMIAKEEMDLAVMKIIAFNEMQAQKANQSKIVKPSFTNRVRGAFGGKHNG